MHCVNCGASVSAGAAFCQSCGKPPGIAGSTVSELSPASNVVKPAPPKKRSKLLGCVGVVVAVFVGLAIIGSIISKKDGSAKSGSAVGAGKDGASGNAAATDSPVAEAELPLAVKASQLFNAYQNNEASAQGYFGGRKLFVTGIVDKVALDILDKAVIRIKSPNDFMSVQASMAQDSQESAKNYNSGERVSLICEDVTSIIGTPMLKDCRPAPANTKTQAIQWKKK